MLKKPNSNLIFKKENNIPILKIEDEDPTDKLLIQPNS